MVKLGIIGGSGAKGVVKALGLEAEVETALVNIDGVGKSVDYLHFTQGGTEVYFILRHNQNHTDLPAKLDQRAMISFLKENGTDAVVLASATGSLDTSVKLVDEGGIVVNSGVFRGFGYQGKSFNDPNNPHAVMTAPFDPATRTLLLQSAAEVGVTAFDGGLYVHNEGNQFESPAEIADLYCRLDAPATRVRDLDLMLEMSKTLGNNGVTVSLQQERELYERLSQHLNTTHTQVGMNAGRETVLALEAGFKHIGLVSFPVNYGTGLVPAEQVDHNRTMNAITKATEPYIVPFLRTVIENAPRYITK
ncbi:MAG: hypothetical protein ABIH82_04735 [Candidatus Woesearchaeota archaeon]